MAGGSQSFGDLPFEGCAQDREVPVFTNGPLAMLEAEKAHRRHAIVEQVIAEAGEGMLGATTREALIHTVPARSSAETRRGR